MSVVRLRLAAHVLCLSIVCIASGCSDKESTARTDSKDDTKPNVCAVSYPLAFFAEEIGGEHITVQFPVPRDEDPAQWDPDAKAVSQFQRADLILLNGAGYAEWVDRISLPDSKVVDTTVDVREKYLYGEDSITHQHGPDGQHTHQQLASTTWLDLQIAIVQARAVKDALSRLLPDKAVAFQDRFDTIQDELNDLDKTLRSEVSDQPPVALVCAQPIYQYLARRYGLSLRCVQWPSDRMPDESAWDELRGLLAEQPVEAMLWQQEPPGDLRRELERLGLSVVVFDPMSNTPAGEDFLKVMDDNVERLKPFLK
ncbi:MAG: metal ABC transporter substrate-binding protein [Planctomycetota bacterium]